MNTYSGNGPYCYANSLHMCLMSAGLDRSVTPGLVECLGGMPFGAAYFRFGDTPTFFPSTPARQPDSALDQALWALGWACESSRASASDSAASALERLRAAPLPVLIGPVDFGKLTYVPNHADFGGSDHYVVALEVAEDRVRVHDPAGYPFAMIPLDDFMVAWEAKTIDYGPSAGLLRYVLRCGFHQAEPLSRAESLQRMVTRIRELNSYSWEGPQVFGGPAAFRALAKDICTESAERQRGHLIWFALPLGARRCTDGATFLAEAGLSAGADCMERKAKLYGEALYDAVHRRWDALACRFEDLAKAEQEFFDVMR